RGDLPETLIDQLVDTGMVRGEGEAVRDDSPQEQVHVRNRQRSPTPITGRARIGPSALGADGQADPVEPADASTTCGNRFDGERRGEDRNSPLLRLGFPLQAPSVSGDVGAG